MNENDLSIIIVSWNAKEFLRACLLSVYKTTPGIKHEVFVIDNASTDGSVEMVKKEFPQVNLTCTTKNLGFAKANNIGIRKSNSRYICLINSDVKVLDACVMLLINYMDQHPKIGVIGPRTFNPDMSPQQSCAEFPTFWNSATFAFGLSKLFPTSKYVGHTYSKYWPFDTLRKVDMIRGSFMMVRKKAIDQVGLLDEEFFMYMEDFDWCNRFWKAGWDVIHYPDAHVIHYQGASSDNDPIKNSIERYRSKLIYWRKYYGLAGACYITVLDCVRQLLKFIIGTLLYLYKPSSRNTFRSNIRESIYYIKWLILNR